MKLDTRLLLIIYAIVSLFLGSTILYFGETDGTNLEKIAVTVSIIGVFLSTCIAIWFANTSRIKSKEENHSYKVALLANLQSLCNDVYSATFSFRAQDEVPRDDFDIVEIKKQTMEDFQYWASLIQARNSNTYVPSYIRDSVSMLLHQGIKPISFGEIPPSEMMLQNTFIIPLGRIIDSEYFRFDQDTTVKKFLKDVKDDRDKLQQLLENNSMEKSLARQGF